MGPLRRRDHHESLRVGSATEPFSARPPNRRALTSHPPYFEGALRAVDKWLAYKRWADRVPGFSVGIFHGEDIIFLAGYGYADLGARRKATPQTCYRIASNSKMFTATAIMQLVDRKKVRLDDPIDAYVDGPGSEQLGRITIRHLLSHLSGVTRDGSTPHWSDGKFPSAAEVEGQLGTKVVYYPPLQRFKYSNFGFALLGKVVAAKGGSGSYREYVEKHIIRSLGMENTFVDYGAGTGLATGYSRLVPGQSRRPFEQVSSEGFAPAAGFISNVSDVCRFLIAHMHGGRPLISELAERELQQPNWMSEDGSRGYGLGYQILKVGDRYVVGHSGGFPGFISRCGMDAKSKLGVVVLTNAGDGPALAYMEGIFHTFQYFEHNEAKFKSRRTDARLRRYEGAFTDRYADVETIVLGSKLFILGMQEARPMDAVLELNRVKGDEFRIEQAEGYEHVGENAVFGFEKGKVSELRIGPNPMRSVPPGKMWKAEWAKPAVHV